MARSSPARRLALLAVVASGYFVGGRAGLLLAAPNPSISVVWPASGIAVAALLLAGVEAWPAVAVGAFFVNLTTIGDPAVAAGMAAGNTAEALVGAILVKRFAGGVDAFDRPTQVLAFALLGAVGASTIAASVGTTTLWAAGHLTTPFATAWSTWWLGDAVGVLEAGSFILIVAQQIGRASRSVSARLAIEAMSVGTASLVVTAIAFAPSSSAPFGGFPFVFIVLPPSVWAAFRFGPIGATGTVSAVSVIAIVATVLHHGPFSAYPLETALDTLRIFVFSLALTCLLVGAEALQRRRAEAGLEEVRRSLETRVAERTASLGTAQELAHLGSWELDVESGRVAWSDEMYRIYGYGTSRVPISLDRALGSIVASDRDRVRSALEQALRSPNPPRDAFSSLPYRIRLANGEERILEGRSKISELREGRPVRMIGTVQDITERVRMLNALKEREAELTRSNRDLEQFAYVASHDLQEPRGLIEGYTRLLTERYGGRLEPGANEFLSQVRDAAVRMRRLIDELLEFSRLAGGSGTFERVPADSALDEALANLRPTLEGARADVSRSSRLPEVEADRVQLVRVFQNLISNALKFRSAEKPQIRIEARLDGAEWVFSVGDNGIGIAPEYHDRIFSIFQRLHTREAYPGTGMGLAICKRIVERHGGRIWVESRGVPREGATFLFTLPVERPTPLAAPSEPSSWERLRQAAAP
jgi:PAS domain S-box-containing protein